MCWQVDSLKVKLLEKLEQSVADLQLNIEEVGNASVDSNHPSTDSTPATAHEVSIWVHNQFCFLIFGK